MGVVLAGGKSRRMGRDKSLLPWRGTTLGGHAAARLAAVCTEVVVADRGGCTVPGVRSVGDGPGEGPAAGILGAVEAFPHGTLLVLACDLPLVSIPLLARLATAMRDADLVMTVSSRGAEPLVARYGPRALSALAFQVARGEFALNRLLATPDLRVHRISGVADEEFHNVNTLDEWRAVAASAAE